MTHALATDRPDHSFGKAVLPRRARRNRFVTDARGSYAAPNHSSNRSPFAAAQKSAFDAVDGSSTRHVGAMDVGAAKAPTIRRSQTCKQSRQSVSILPSLFFKSTELTRQVM